MKNTTPLARAAALLRRTWSALDHLIFRASDLDAVARGWEVHGVGRGRRIYRDPRWHSIVVCAECRGSGLVGARSCPDCDGQGTLRRTPADSGVPR